MALSPRKVGYKAPLQGREIHFLLLHFFAPQFIRINKPGSSPRFATANNPLPFCLLFATAPPAPTADAPLPSGILLFNNNALMNICAALLRSPPRHRSNAPPSVHRSIRPDHRASAPPKIVITSARHTPVLSGAFPPPPPHAPPSERLDFSSDLQNYHGCVACLVFQAKT